MEGLGS